MSKDNLFNQDPLTHESGSHPVGAGAGAAAGALAGAAAGLPAGPIGVVVGAVAGGVVGGLAGKEVAEQLDPTPFGAPDEHKIEIGTGATVGAVAGAILGAPAGPIGMAALSAAGAAAGGWVGSGIGEAEHPEQVDQYWREAHSARPYYSADRAYEDYRPAYIIGHAHRVSGGMLVGQEDSLRSIWERAKGSSRLTWDEAREAVHDAWERADH